MRGCGGSKLLQIVKQRHLRFSLSDGFLRGCCYSFVSAVYFGLFGVHEHSYKLFFLPIGKRSGLLLIGDSMHHRLSDCQVREHFYDGLHCLFD